MTAVNQFAGLTGVVGFLNSSIESPAKEAGSGQSCDIPALTARMARGEEVAFHEFYRLYFGRLFRYLMVVTSGKEEVVREGLQLTFLRVARHVRRFESEAAFWNWLAMLARNCVVDEVRRSTRYQNMLARFVQRGRTDVDSERGVADEKFLKLLEAEIQRLPADERALIERKYIADETARHLAEELQVTEKAMESRLLRIRRKLKAAIFDRLKNETTE